MSLFCLYFWGIIWSPFCSLLTHCSGQLVDWTQSPKFISPLNSSSWNLRSVSSAPAAAFSSLMSFESPLNIQTLGVPRIWVGLACRSGGSPGTEDCPSPGSLHGPHSCPGICKQEILWLYFLCVGVLKLLQSGSLDAQKATCEPHVGGLCLLI